MSNEPDDMMVAISNDQEIDRFARILERSFAKRGPEGMLASAASMMAACADMFAFTLGPEEGYVTMRRALDEFFGRLKAEQQQEMN